MKSLGGDGPAKVMDAAAVDTSQPSTASAGEFSV